MGGAPGAQLCSACHELAEYDTPRGPFCEDHMIEEIVADDVLWLPKRLFPARSG